MKTLIAHKIVGDEELHFVLVDECYSEGDEPFTLFAFINYYSRLRTERAREFFQTLEAAFEYCQQNYGITEIAP